MLMPKFELRDRRLFGDGSWCLRDVVRRAEGLLSEFREATNENISSTSPTVQNLSAPSQGRFKVNFDAAWNREDGRTGIGVVIRDSSGDFLAGLSKRGPRALSAEAAETIAAKEAVVFAVEAGFTNMVVEGDNQSVIAAIRNGEVILQSAGVIIEDILKIVELLPNVEFSFARRECNGVAHLFAKHASSINDYLVWLEEPPVWASQSV